ncbi:LysR family transcriptional regulator [Pseudooceanicola sp. 216_PA32_1]|uniref:LysR family transcriptional regulator n=1 Tax=Pseudooceanicola pacificus TaxID=2676438 RepID=A0A844W065_9RHOB|nr:LysR family transcriptional regulator [Pseudooceanicola pacificus]MWB77456.1 LysR family transcriptional regulator [Pseudooceanicola pacificus]
MKNWDDLRYLIAVHKTGSMSAAARLLDTNPATVSRRLGRLGEALGFDLFVKTPEGWVANEAISDLIESATNFENEIVTYLNAKSDQDQPSSGTITIGCPPAISTYVLYPALNQFLVDWPNVSMVFNSQMFTEALGENDMIVVPVRPTQGRLVVRNVGRMRMNVFCYPDSPRTGIWIGLNRAHEPQPPMQKAREIMGGGDPYFRVETLHEVANMVKSTRLPGLMPNVAATREEGLEKFDPESRDIESQMYLCFHETRRKDPLLRAVADWVIAQFNATSDL